MQNSESDPILLFRIHSCFNGP